MKKSGSNNCLNRGSSPRDQRSDMKKASSNNSLNRGSSSRDQRSDMKKSSSTSFLDRASSSRDRRSKSSRRLQHNERSGKSVPSEPSVQDILMDQTALIRITLEGTNLEEVGGWFSKTNPYYQVTREPTELEKCDVSTRDNWKMVHRSEHIPDSRNPIWRSAVLPLFLLCNGDLKTKVRISCYSRDDASNSTPMGHFETTLGGLKRAVDNPAKEFTLKGEDGHVFGTIRVIEASLPEELEGCFSDDESSHNNGIDNSGTQGSVRSRGRHTEKEANNSFGLPMEIIKLSQSTGNSGDQAQEIKNLKKQLEEKDALLEEAQEAMQFLESALNKGRNDQESLSATNAGLGQELEQRKRENEALDAKNTQLQQELDEARTGLSGVNAEKEEIEGLIAEKSALEEELAKSKIEANDCLDKLNKANSRIEQCNEELEKQQQTCARLEKETKVAAEEAALNLSRLEQHIKVKEDLIESMRSRTGDLENEVAKLEKQLSGAKQELMTTFEQFEGRVLKTIRNPPSKKKDYKERLAEKSGIDRATLEIMMLDAENKVQAHEEKALADILRIQKLSANCKSLEEEIATSRKKLQARQDASNISDGEILHLQGECKRLSLLNNELTEALKVAKDATNARDDEIFELRKTTRLVQEQLESLEKEKLEQATQQSESDAALLDQAEAKATADAAKILGLNEGIQSLTAKLNESHAEMVKLKERIASQELSATTERDLKQEVEFLKQNLQQAQKAILALKAEKAENLRQSIEAAENSGNLSAEAMVTLSKLKAERDSLETKCGQLEDRIKQLERAEAMLSSLAEKIPGGSSTADVKEIPSSIHEGNTQGSKPISPPCGASAKAPPADTAPGATQAQSIQSFAGVFAAPRATPLKNIPHLSNVSGIAAASLMAKAAKAKRKKSASTNDLLKLAAQAKAPKEESNQNSSSSTRPGRSVTRKAGKASDPLSNSLHNPKTAQIGSKSSGNRMKDETKSLRGTRSTTARSNSTSRLVAKPSPRGIGLSKARIPRSNSTNRLTRKDTSSADGKGSRRRRNRSMTRLEDMMQKVNAPNL